MDSVVFKRGQIWYWEDPLYGPKSGGKEPMLGEGGLRFSRYVLIVGSDFNISQIGSVLVVPLSSRNSQPSDVKLIVRHSYDRNFSYAKCGYIFPAQKKMLKNYLCTISDEDMRNIDSQIIKSLCPYIEETLSAQDIFNTFGINMGYNCRREDHLTIPLYEAGVRTFISDHILRTGEATDVVKLKDLKQAFDIYCLNHMIPIHQDALYFLEVFIRYINASTLGLTNWRYVDQTISQMTELRGIRLDPNVKVQINLKFEALKEDRDIIQKHAEEVNPTVQPKPAEEPKEPEKDVEPVVIKRTWTTEAKQKFLEDYESLGKSACARKYGITPATCLAYRGKWIKSQPVKPKEPEEKKEEPTPPPTPAPAPTTPSEPDNIIAPPNVNDIVDSISNISNLMCSFLKTQDVYRSDKIPMNEGLYYQKLSNTLFRSLINFLDIRELSKCTYSMPGNLKAHPQATWKFFDIAVHDNRVFGAPSMEDLCSRIDNLYGSNNIVFGKIRIESRWLTTLNSKLQTAQIPIKHRTTIVNMLKRFTV